MEQVSIISALQMSREEYKEVEQFGSDHSVNQWQNQEQDWEVPGSARLCWNHSAALLPM